MFPQFQVREVDWSFHNLPYAFLETGPVVSLPSPGTSCILDFPKNIDNNPEIISESPFNSKEAIQLSLENLNSFKVNDTLTILIVLKFNFCGLGFFSFLLLEK